MTDDKHVFQPGDLVLIGDEPSLEDGSDWEILSLLSRCIGSVVIGPDEDGDILVMLVEGMSDGPDEWYIGKSHLTPVSNESEVLVGESPSLEDGSDWEILSTLSRRVTILVQDPSHHADDILVESNEWLEGGAE